MFNEETTKDYRMISQIGSGSLADVWKAEKDGLYYALKIFKSTKASE